MKDFLITDSKLTVVADERMNNKTVKNLWNSFCFTLGEINFEKGENSTFLLGDVSLPTLQAGKEYALKVDENGIAIVGKDYGGLMRGFISLLMKIEYENEILKIKAIAEESDYTIKNRMIHICVFPENDLYYIKKLIRLAGLCQYTHIVIEFWGMLKYDCLKELAWPHAFTKEQARDLLQEVRELGMEPIPMFNQLGHATASRLCYGKHVVLDQNPRLQELFTPDGWAWNIYSDKVKQLLKQIRIELYELFEDCSYIHLGCDEAYYYMRSETDRAATASFLQELTEEVAAEGKRPMLWMDMMLENNHYPKCYITNCPHGDADRLIRGLHPSTVMVDWQYDVTEAPVLTSLDLNKTGYDVVIAPWLNAANYNACINTIPEHDLFGLMLTTWHTLGHQMTGILGCAKKCGAAEFPWSPNSGWHEETATLLRRVSFEGNTYEDCGWMKQQIPVLFM